jgi:hypothetical protein
LTSFILIHGVGASLSRDLAQQQAAVYRQHHPPTPLAQPLRSRPVR